MKQFALTLFLISLGSHATTTTNCRLIEGLYQNSLTPIEDLSFETYADIFTLTNAHTVSLTLNHENLRFVRTVLKVDRHTEMVYVQRKDQEIVRAIHITLDRTPRLIARSRQFYGYLLISPLNSSAGFIGKDVLNYNFYCQF